MRIPSSRLAHKPQGELRVRSENVRLSRDPRSGTLRAGRLLRDTTGYVARGRSTGRTSEISVAELVPGRASGTGSAPTAIRPGSGLAGEAATASGASRLVLPVIIGSTEARAGGAGSTSETHLFAGAAVVAAGVTAGAGRTAGAGFDNRIGVETDTEEVRASP